MQRRRLEISGDVQGRGFRPLFYRLAKRHALSGWVKNAQHQVLVEVQGEINSLENFEMQARELFSQGAEITSSPRPVEASTNAFSITSSETGFSRIGDLPVDIATCPECLDELNDPANRRFHYPFINCAACGPRYSITEAMPYDRVRTSMSDFPLCSSCLSEYENESDRRFHAETISCWDCGPTLELWDKESCSLSKKAGALTQAVELLEAGKIIAVKGVGGFHLMVDPENRASVENLRQRKTRPHKPFAVLFPNLSSLMEVTHASDDEKRELLSSAAPIVLLNAKSEGKLASAMVPGGNLIGAFLPSNSLHHLLCARFSRPLIATSANRKGEPLCFDERSAVKQLNGIADYFLVHNRSILRPVDDSILRWMGSHRTLLRRARGYSSRISNLESKEAHFGAGSFLKNTCAWTEKGSLFLSPHLGDMEHPETHRLWNRRYEETFNGEENTVVLDLHPDYPGHSLKNKQIRVQHHKAHVLSGMVDQRLSPPFLGVAWDGSGLGDDGKLWGGEFFEVERGNIDRVASFRPFPLLGGERAVRDPRRVALSLLWESEVPSPQLEYSERELDVLRGMFDKQIQSPLCSSVGRIFDGLAAITGISLQNSFEGHAASLVEAKGSRWHEQEEPYVFLQEEQLLDWRPMIREISREVIHGIAIERICYRFHLTLADMIVAIARQHNQRRVLLTGGCFQNAVLTRLAVQRLEENGITPYWHSEIPPNDGGLSVGQVIAGLEGLCV